MSVNPLYQTFGKNNHYFQTKTAQFAKVNGSQAYELCDKSFDDRSANAILMTKEVVTKESLSASKDVYVQHTLPSDGSLVKRRLDQIQSFRGNYIRFAMGYNEDDIVKVTF